MTAQFLTGATNVAGVIEIFRNGGASRKINPGDVITVTFGSAYAAIPAIMITKGQNTGGTATDLWSVVVSVVSPGTTSFNILFTSGTSQNLTNNAQRLYVSYCVIGST